MNFCSKCGERVERTVPPGDDRERYACPSCGAIHYRNPRLVVGCVPEWKDRILLCLRAIEPCDNMWTLPAGYLENGESVIEGALREAREEARANLTDPEPYSLYSIVHISQVYLLFRARLLDTNFSPGKETREVRLFALSEIPWEEIAFQAVKRTLEQYVEDSASGRFPFRMGDIRRRPSGWRPQQLHGDV